MRDGAFRSPQGNRSKFRSVTRDLIPAGGSQPAVGDGRGINHEGLGVEHDAQEGRVSWDREDELNAATLRNRLWGEHVKPRGRQPKRRTYPLSGRLLCRCGLSAQP